jgi:hypothetical protein
MAGRKKISCATSRRLVSPKSDEGGSIAKTEEMRKRIHALRGSFETPGDKPFAEEWAEYKREEKELEERKFQRRATVGKKSAG